MQLKSKHSLAVPLASAIGLIACSHGNAGTTSTTAAPLPPPPEMQAAPTPVPVPSTHQREIAYLATARCDHQQACNNIGAGKQFVSQDACMKEMQRQGLSETYRLQCPGDIDTQRLQTCGAEIRASNCGDHTDATNHFDACSASALCPSMNTP